MSSSSHDGERLTEEFVQDAFHSYLKSSLTQAKVEKLLDAEILASAEGDLMITGPALCFYFAALRCTTSPPSVPLPRSHKNTSPLDLSPSNCPEAFVSFLNVWSSAVPRIQALAPEHQHNLARIICNLPPLTQDDQVNIRLNGIAADLRAVAIEISQRRSFQERYTGDLQAALDSGIPSGIKVKASFVPPPVYDPSPTSSAGSSPLSSPRLHSPQLPPRSPIQGSSSQRIPPQSPTYLSPYSVPRTPSPSRKILGEDSPAIEAIRETLYASLADVLDRMPSLRLLLKRDAPRAYFASVAFAILEVATTSITPEGSVVGVLGRELTLDQCPRELRPFMTELGAIGRLVKEVEEQDTEEAMRRAQAGRDIPPPRMERVKKMLEEGVGHDLHARPASRSSSRSSSEEREGRRSVEGRAVAFANRVNALALGLTRLPAFRERQNDVFKVLAGIGS